MTTDAEIAEAIRCCREETRAITFAECADLIERLAGELADAREVLSEMDKQVAARDVEVKRLAGELAETSAHVERIAVSLGKSESHIEYLNGQLAARDSELAAVKGERNNWTVEVERLRAELLTRDAELKVVARSGISVSLDEWSAMCAIEALAREVKRTQPEAQFTIDAVNRLDDIRALAKLTKKEADGG